MSDMTAAIVPKSDQLNSDDLISGPISIRITATSVRPGTEQPVSIAYDGDNGKPWKPCKSMSRVLVTAWGPDSSKYVGKSLTLYRDPKVTWGGMEVGGIRISHMSDIQAPMTMALTATKQSKKLFTVQPLKDAPKSRTPLDTPPAKLADPLPTDPHDWADAVEAIIDGATDPVLLKGNFLALKEQPQWVALKEADEGRAKELHTKEAAKRKALATAVKEGA